MADEHEEEHKPPEHHEHKGEEHKEGEAPKKGMSADWKDMPKWEKAGIIIGAATLVFLIISWWANQNSQNNQGQGQAGQLPIGVPPNTQSSDMWPPVPGPVPPGSTNPPPSGGGHHKPPHGGGGQGGHPHNQKPPKGGGGSHDGGGQNQKPPKGGPHMQPGAFGPGHGTPGGGGGQTGKSSGTITPQHTPGPGTHPGTGNKKPTPAGAGFNTLPQLLPNGVPITQFHGVGGGPTWNNGVLWNPGDWIAKLTNGTFLDLSHKYPGIKVTYGSGGRVWYQRPGMANQQLLTGG